MLVDANSPNAGGVTGAIRQAARLTGTNFQYLLAAAKVESNLDPSAGARSSSAGGLFQFIDQTWLGTIKQSGAELGYGRYAQAIEQTGSGRYVVSDPSMRAEIMKLRRDPTANAVMAGAFTKANAQYLTQKLGRAPTDGELYAAHFLGPRGAAKLIGLSNATPNALASDSFPQAARANRSIFYNSDGRPRSFAEVTNTLASRYNVAVAATSDRVATPAASATPARAANAYEAAAPAPTPAKVAAVLSPEEDSAAAFRKMYHLARDARLAAEARLSKASTADKTVVAAVQPQQVNAPNADSEALGLFQDIRPNVRALFTGG